MAGSSVLIERVQLENFLKKKRVFLFIGWEKLLEFFFLKLPLFQIKIFLHKSKAPKKIGYLKHIPIFSQISRNQINVKRIRG